MRFIHSLTRSTLFLLCALAALAGCADSKDADRFDDDYGYVQIKIYKNVTPIETRVGQLDYLRDAYKIKLTFLYNNAEISNIGFFEYNDEETAEFGLRTDRLKLLKGTYTLTSYTIYDDLDNALVNVYLDEEIVVESGKLTLKELDVDAVNRGKISFDLVKDFSKFNTTRARNREYAFSEIRQANVVLVNVDSPYIDVPLNGMKTTSGNDMKGSYYMTTDTTYSLVAGKYLLKSYSLYSSATSTSSLYLLESRTTFDEPVYYVVQDNQTTEADLPVELVESDEYIKDYYALKEIWESLNGPDWYYYGKTHAEGSNWNFDKDIDMWGNQPGVELHSNGRVGALIIGGFGPYGEVPDAIGQLTEMAEMSLGANYDPYVDQDFTSRSGTVSRSSYPILVPGDGRNENILENPIARKWAGKLSGSITDAKLEDTRLWKRSTRVRSDIEKAERQLRGEPEEIIYARSGYASYGLHTNGITKISEEIGKLTKMTHLYISNTLVEELPQSLGDLVNVTDLDLYNNSKLKEFPVQIANMPSLVMLNLSENRQWSPDEIYRGLDAIFEGPSNVLQGLYANNTRLQKVPESIKNCSKLYLLDLAWCELSGIMTPFTDNVRIGMLYLDHNQITGFPQGFADFRDCEDFTVSFNKITMFPNIFNNEVYERCENVDFSYNQITGVEGEAEGVFRGVIADKLDLSNNRITDFPLAFNNKKTEVKYYSFAMNEIEEIPEEALDGMWQGTLSFNLTGNKLSELPVSFNATNFPYLYSVDFSYNRFTSIPINPLSSASLAVYIIQGQRDENDNRCLRSFLNTLYTHTGLGYVDIRGNDILSIGAEWPRRLTVFLVRDNPNIVITVPSTYCSTINYVLYYDNTQNITGCPQLTTDAQKEL